MRKQQQAAEDDLARAAPTSRVSSGASIAGQDGRHPAHVHALLAGVEEIFSAFQQIRFPDQPTPRITPDAVARTEPRQATDDNAKWKTHCWLSFAPTCGGDPV